MSVAEIAVTSREQAEAVKRFLIGPHDGFGGGFLRQTSVQRQNGEVEVQRADDAEIGVFDGIGCSVLGAYETISKEAARRAGLTGDCVREVAGWYCHGRTGLKWPA